MHYAIVIENVGKNYGANVPDLPGCVAMGDSAEEAKRNIAEAIKFHIEGLTEDGLDIPEPTSIVEYIAA